MNIVIRADASTQIGTGHVMRCLALSQRWKAKGGQAIFVLASKSPSLEARLIFEEMEVVYLSGEAGGNQDAQQTIDFCKQFSAQWIILDGYHFGSAYQKTIKNFGISLLCLDDYGHSNHYYADLILNQNISANIALYQSREPYTQLLLGTQYVLLRKEFLSWKNRQRVINPIASKILVTLGGSDPDNVTLKVIQALQQVNSDNLKVIVVVGGSNPHYEKLQTEVEKSRILITLQRNVSNMPELMAWADVAITGGGSTCWELAFMGLPSLILILAENQRAIAEKLNQAGIVQTLGWSMRQTADTIAQQIIRILQSEEIRTGMTQLGQALVDGQGYDRVLMILEGKALRLRKAHPEDCELLWKWANDSEVRACSFSTKPIPWDTHVSWFSKQLKDSSCHFLIGINDKDKPIGQVRFDTWDNEHAAISISLDSNQRGLGYGTLLINLGVDELLRQTPVKTIHAWIKPYNLASCKVFEKTQFKRLTEEVIKGHPAIHYLRTR